VLFSRADVSNFINRYFEPAWVSVRPVPLVRIDFGNEQVITRTLHGNIATSVCDAGGRVLDILPGIYTAPVYLDRLNQFRLLANYASQVKGVEQEKRLRDYHRAQAEALKRRQVPDRFVNAAPITKRAIEGPVKAILVAGRIAVSESTGLLPGPQHAERLASKEDVASWKELAEDTRVNESIRRQQIHDILAEAGLVVPQQVVKRLYKEVLHADLDDPYLGLGNILFAQYPFAREDKGN
jgi:hypothetical protein